MGLYEANESSRGKPSVWRVFMSSWCVIFNQHLSTVREDGAGGLDLSVFLHTVATARHGAGTLLYLTSS